MFVCACQWFVGFLTLTMIWAHWLFLTGSLCIYIYKYAYKKKHHPILIFLRCSAKVEDLDETLPVSSESCHEEFQASYLAGAGPGTQGHVCIDQKNAGFFWAKSTGQEKLFGNWRQCCDISPHRRKRLDFDTLWRKSVEWCDNLGCGSLHCQVQTCLVIHEV